MSTSTQKSVFRLAVIAAAVLAAQAFAALPELRINTQNNTIPTSSIDGGCNSNSSGGGGACDWSNPMGCMNGGGWDWWGGGGGLPSNPWNFPYVAATSIQITDQGSPMNNLNRNTTRDSIRLRGNSTSQADKKPYRLKFGDKISLFGKEPARSWVLLANYYDGTFALNAMAFELGRRMGLEFTPTYKFVDFHLNNQYMGIYQLTEQIQSHKGRVDLKEKHGGWLVEADYHSPASDECKNWFTAAKYNLTTFIKSPELDDSSFTKNPNDSASLRFVKTDINNLVNKMSEGGFPNNGYRELIDLESFAKYVLIELVLDNSDFNSKFQSGALPGSNYFYRADSGKTTKISAGPLWDFDLAAVTSSSHPRHDWNNYRETVTPTHEFYQRLWADDVFKAKYRKAWTKHKRDFQAMSGVIDSIKGLVEGSVVGKGNNKWNGVDITSFGSVTLTQQQFNTEVSNLKTWWTNRLNYVEQQLAGIDTTKDIVEEAQKNPTSAGSGAAGFGKAKAGNGLAAVKNGLRIHSTGEASVKVVSLTGGVVRKQAFAAGSHTVNLSDLPRGMYLARVNLDGVKTTVRVAVR